MGNQGGNWGVSVKEMKGLGGKTMQTRGINIGQPRSFEGAEKGWGGVKTLFWSGK